MEFLIWLVVVIFIVGAGFFWLQSVRKRNMEQISGAVSREAAQAAAARLDEESRKSIYRNLAQGDVMGAVQNYRALTGASVKECVIAVRSLDAYPQTGAAQEPTGDGGDFEPLREKLDEPQHGPSEGEHPAPGPQSAKDQPPAQGTSPSEGTEPPTSASGGHQTTSAEDAWVVPSEWNDQFGSDKAPSSTHFKLAYEVDGEQHEFSSEKLPANEYDQLFSMLRDGDTEGAAQILHQHTELPVEDLERMIATSPMAGGEGTGNVADFRFEGQGPDGPVYFDAADLPEDEREELFEAIARTDLERMSAIIVKHTSLPEDIVQNMLRSFVQRED